MVSFVARSQKSAKLAGPPSVLYVVELQPMDHYSDHSWSWAVAQTNLVGAALFGSDTDLSLALHSQAIAQKLFEPSILVQRQNLGYYLIRFCFVHQFTKQLHFHPNHICSRINCHAS